MKNLMMSTAALLMATGVMAQVVKTKAEKTIDSVKALQKQEQSAPVPQTKVTDDALPLRQEQLNNVNDLNRINDNGNINGNSVDQNGVYGGSNPNTATNRNTSIYNTTRGKQGEQTSATDDTNYPSQQRTTTTGSPATQLPRESTRPFDTVKKKANQTKSKVRKTNGAAIRK